MNDDADLDPLAVDAVEALLADAADYVVPPPDLRLRVLEVVRERASAIRSARRFGGWALATVAVWMAVVVALHRSVDLRHMPNAERTQALANRWSASPAYNVDWALVDAFRFVRFSSPFTWDESMGAVPSSRHARENANVR
ncbi:MAG: hypothetical protein KatS3mg111_3942 [Pirellulaceae bacterium]|nr:MAG: hypothetical protein KatS3mg111_3942 [Pirellulaceae bacterium]